MKLTPVEPPREFPVGDGSIRIKDCARIALEADEQVTFVTASGAEYDVARKAWGYYATPSINGRLRDHGFKTALVRNVTTGRYYVMLVDRARLSEFEAYVQREAQVVVEWLDERE